MASLFIYTLWIKHKAPHIHVSYQENEAVIALPDSKVSFIFLLLSFLCLVLVL
ncbi:MAG: DUF4160 domain-containing protein [Kiritimatiellae bacterium]|jgi:hypothetical protein|nr:DUF4160 domain-containing protein [Kiritimatiellia bacterium]